MLKGLDGELGQNACDVVNEQKTFCSHQCPLECSMNKFRGYISTDTCFVLPRTHQCGSGYRVENNWCHQIAQSTRCWALPKCLWCGDRTKNILFSSVFSRVLNEYNNWMNIMNIILNIITYIYNWLNQTWRLTNAIAEIKSDTEQIMKLE